MNGDERAIYNDYVNGYIRMCIVYIMCTLFMSILIKLSSIVIGVTIVCVKIAPMISSTDSTILHIIIYVHYYVCNKVYYILGYRWCYKHLIVREKRLRFRIFFLKIFLHTCALCMDKPICEN